MQGTKEISELVAQLRNLQRERDNLDAEIEAIKDLIKEELTQVAEDTILGEDYVVTWKEVTRSTIDSKSLRNHLPEVAKQFTRTSTYRQFLLK